MESIVRELIDSGKDISEKCLSELVERGYLSSAELLYVEKFALKAQATSGLSQVKQKSVAVKKELEMFHTIMMSSKKEVQVVEPVFQWAQSKSHVYLQVKLAMRLDSPACLTCREEAITISNRTLFMSAFGVVSHSPVRFLMNLTLAEDIEDLPLSQWNYESVGTFFISLVKKNATNIWLDLESTTNRKVQVWWDMREKHKSDMEEWSRLREEAEDQLEFAKTEAKRKAKQIRAEKKQAKAKKVAQAAEEKLLKKQKEDEEQDSKSWGSWFKNVVG